jgi:hypothetical protein
MVDGDSTTCSLHGWNIDLAGGEAKSLTKAARAPSPCTSTNSARCIFACPEPAHGGTMKTVTLDHRTAAHLNRSTLPQDKENSPWRKYLFFTTQSTDTPKNLHELWSMARGQRVQT